MENGGGGDKLKEAAIPGRGKKRPPSPASSPSDDGEDSSMYTSDDDCWEFSEEEQEEGEENDDEEYRDTATSPAEKRKSPMVKLMKRLIKRLQADTKAVTENLQQSRASKIAMKKELVQKWKQQKVEEIARCMALVKECGFEEVPSDVAGSNNTQASTSASAGTGTGPGKRRSPVWENFTEVNEVVDGKNVCTGICNFCKARLTANSAGGTGHLIRHARSCKKKADHDRMVQNRLVMNPDGSFRNWEYDPQIARTELCRLIARLDLPLSIADTDAWDDYIRVAHNPRYTRVSRFTTARDLAKLYNEKVKKLKEIVFPGASAICLTSDIWSGNAEEDYIAVVAHFVNPDWELKKAVIGFKLIEVSHNGINIAERIASVVQEFGMIDKVFSVTLDNASAISTAILSPLLAGYLGSDVDPSDPSKTIYNVVHQRCACHIINLIVKSGLHMIKDDLDVFRTAINFLNSSNSRIAQFSNYCKAKGCQPRKFGLDMDVRWNSTYLMLKHLLPYKAVFSVWINTNYGYPLLNAQHWYIAGKIMDFLELFYESTVVLSGVYYPTSPLVLHHILEFASHMHENENDPKLSAIIEPMKTEFLKYWKNIPLLYSFAFVLDPRAKMRGLYNILQLLSQTNNYSYASYFAQVKTELYKLYGKYETKFGAARPPRTTHPSGMTGKRKQICGKIFGDSGVSGPSPASGSSSRTAASANLYELTVYLDSDNVVDYEDEFDILNWWHEHKLTYPILSILARDIMSVPASTTSSESTFSLSGRIIEDKRRRLNPETVEMLVCIKDWELGQQRAQHQVEDKELEESFKELWVEDEPVNADPSATATAT